MCQHNLAHIPQIKRVPYNRKRKFDNFDQIIILILGNINSDSKWLTIADEHSGWHPFKQKQYAHRTNPTYSKKSSYLTIFQLQL